MSFSRESFIREAKYQNKSDSYLSETLSYAENLGGRGLPVLFSTKHLSLALDLPYIDLKHLITNREHYYKYYQIKKKRGGYRQICAPFSNLKDIQKWINTEILAKTPISEAATGFVIGRSTKTNADPHRNKNFILNIDLLKFFDCIPEYKVYESFKSLGYHANLALDLAKLTTVPLQEDYFHSFEKNEQKIFNKFFQKEVGVLPQGAPTSPTISNIVANELDEKLMAIARDTGCCYTRYADDITFSNDKYENLPRITEILNIVKLLGFFINWKKCKIYKKGQRQLVTGLTISHGVHVPKKYRREVHRHIHFCKKFGPEKHLIRLNFSEKKFFKEWLLGKIFYISSINEREGKKLLFNFNQISWPF